MQRRARRSRLRRPTAKNYFEMPCCRCLCAMSLLDRSSIPPIYTVHLRRGFAHIGGDADAEFKSGPRAGYVINAHQ